jgi:hypothetical protein
LHNVVNIRMKRLIARNAVVDFPVRGSKGSCHRTVAAICQHGVCLLASRPQKLLVAVVDKYVALLAYLYVVGVEVVDGEVVDGLFGGVTYCDVVDEEGDAGVVEEVVAWL